MKIRFPVTFLVLLLALFSNVLCIAEETYQIIIADSAAEPIFGTWINKEYDGSRGRQAQKRIHYSWGYAEAYKKIADEVPFQKYTIMLVEKWKDLKGDIWYKTIFQDLGGRYFMLFRLSKDGTTLEMIERSAGFPSEKDMNKSYSNYWIYKRQ